MATILPGSPPSYDKNNVQGTVKALCSYARTLQENLDFQLSGFKREISAAQGEIETIKKTVSTLQKGLETAQKSIETLTSDYNKLAERVASLEQKTTN